MVATSAQHDMSYTVSGPLSHLELGKPELSHQVGFIGSFSRASSRTSTPDVHAGFEEIAIDITCFYCGSYKDGRRSAYKTVAVDTSDLDIHYEFYRPKQARTFKSIATDTYDLSCKKPPSNKHLKFISDCARDSSDSSGYVRERNTEFKQNMSVDGILEVDSVSHAQDNCVDHSAFIAFPSETRLANENDDPNWGECHTKVGSGVETHARGASTLCHNEKELPTHCYVNDICDIDCKFGNRVENLKLAIEEPSPKYECDVCKETFDSMQILSDHLENHNKERVWLGVTNDDDLTPVNAPFECKVCGDKFGIKKELSSHHCSVSKFKSFQCRICKQVFSSSKCINEHGSAFHGESSSLLIGGCNNAKGRKRKGGRKICFIDEELPKYCVEEEEDKDKLDTVRTKGSEPLSDGEQDGLMTAGRVKKKNEVKENVLKRKLPKVPIECLTCGKVFRGWSALKNHETVHTGERNFVCEICKKAFPTKACLKSHGSTHSGLKPYACSTCPKAFAHKESLRTHVRTHTGERPFTCDMCGQAFNRSFTLSMHKRIHTGEKKHVCHCCGQAFTTNSALRSHERRKHSAVPPPKPRRVYKYRPKDPYICDVCGKVCTSAANLRFHSANHTGIRPFVCTVCGKAYPMKQTLQRHMMRHADQRPFVCDVCGLAFFRSTTLNVHKLRHTGEKPHVCSLCGKGFIQSSSLAYHLRNHNRPPRNPEAKAKCKRKSIGTPPHNLKSVLEHIPHSISQAGPQCHGHHAGHT